MSRSALWRQEGNVKERERRAVEIFQQACTEGRTRSKSTLPLWGPDNDTFHFNPLLLHNTIHSPYFQKCCTEHNDWTSIIDEIYYEVKHMQVFQVAKQPSTAFCLLLRLLCLRMTSHELDQTISHTDSPYIRAIGFLFIRYGGCPPEQVWERIGPYIHDEEEISIEASGKQSNNNSTITIGEFVRKVFQERDYYNTTPLPRFPLQIEREIQVKLLAADKIADRAKQHSSNTRSMQYFQTIGNQVRALYGDDENPITWYDAIIDRIITRSDDGQRLLKYPKFVVTFPEYGNTETVLLGEIDFRDSSTDKDSSAKNGKSSYASSNNNNNRNYGRGYDNNNNDKNFNSSSSRYHDRRPHDHNNNNNHPRRIDEKDLYDEVRNAERAKVATTDKGNWARRPPSTKSNLTLKGPTTTTAISDDDRYSNHHHHQQQHPNNTKQQPTSTRNDPGGNTTNQSNNVPNRKRTAEELAVIEEKKRRLLSKYG